MKIYKQNYGFCLVQGDVSQLSLERTVNKDAVDFRGSGPLSWWETSDCPTSCSGFFCGRCGTVGRPRERRGFVHSYSHVVLFRLSCSFPPEVSAGFDEAHGWFQRETECPELGELASMSRWEANKGRLREPGAQTLCDGGGGGDLTPPLLVCRKPSHSLLSVHSSDLGQGWETGGSCCSQHLWTIEKIK